MTVGLTDDVIGVVIGVIAIGLCTVTLDVMQLVGRLIEQTRKGNVPIPLNVGDGVKLSVPFAFTLTLPKFGCCGMLKLTVLVVAGLPFTVTFGSTWMTVGLVPGDKTEVIGVTTI